jgi:predicted Rossmann-fold nucleotide-binding protein
MAGRKLTILVAGGLDKKDERALARSPAEIMSFARTLGEEMMRQGHVLLTGCRTDLDSSVADGAEQYLLSQNATNEVLHRRIVSYVNQGTEPIHKHGAILQSELVDWELGGKDLNAPEIIRYADAVILIGGFRGTYRAANWARIERKPLLPIALFGGAAKDICLEEAKRVETLYPENVSKKDYEAVLKSLSTDWNQLATTVINLAERMVTSREVFVIMSFKDSPEYKDLRIAIQKACQRFGYNARRVDESSDRKRIIPEIMRGIRQSAFIIADISEDKSNVYWELGLASGMNKDIIVVAKKGSNRPFDVNDVPVLYWESFSQFEEDLAKHVEAIATQQGRE